MPDRRAHRGPHPEDAELFSPAQLDRLREATTDLCWLASRGYAEVSSLKLVGDRYHLTARQRLAAARCACSETQLRRRLEHEVRPSKTTLLGSSPAAGSLGGAETRTCQPGLLAGQSVWIDGYNVLTTVEAALAGGVILHARDGTFRDMASMHGTFRKVAETEPALEMIGQTLAQFRPNECVWYLDRPVSNSGRLKQWIEQTAQKHHWPWRVELAANPDPILWQSPAIVASADSVILDHCQRWLNLARWVVEHYAPGAWIVQL
ncbi:MAG TPA: DUF434 domain-containing protein [Thermoguttaceae bacterium]|nr:DUF434 domain-containing protein [Thermoguttaceae bacterium]HPP52222.1 DUF434 domain-containing protein [Thermoguttaceae bacterium]